jgi:hypothetical protein
MSSPGPVSILNAQPATRISQLLAQVAQLIKRPNLDSERPNMEEKAWLDVVVTGGTLQVPVARITCRCT